MYKNKKISLVIPCYNEEDGLPATFKLVPSYIDEVVVVDNNCTDKTAEIAKKFGARVVKEKKQGYGWAYQKGLYSAKGDIIVTGDADGTYPIQHSKKIINYLLKNNYDFVSCARLPLKNKGSMTATSLIGNYLLNWAMSLLTLRKINDSQSGMWVFKKDSLSKLNLTNGDMAFSEEIKMEALFHPEIKFNEYHIDYYPRTGDTKLMPWKHGYKNLIFLFKKRWQILSNKKRKK